MASCKVYIVVICVLLCIAISILDGCPRRRRTRTCKFGKTVYRDRAHRRSMNPKCSVYECDNTEWRFLYTVCMWNDLCYDEHRLLTIKGVAMECQAVSNTKSEWKKFYTGPKPTGIVADILKSWNITGSQIAENRWSRLVCSSSRWRHRESIMGVKGEEKRNYHGSDVCRNRESIMGMKGAETENLSWE
ncbi:hypothetical protein PoB_007064000 [Plakobranchus ocellatus]|uniref:Uncharacterized protein n=1 Tax=Plakobranchus ocellatus TaxID=259542 RepID=A0AAV4DJI2_9GAST|nr:hypothetical protein PoB_007064000 [Plakobranchus ocellatus]